MTGKTGGTVVSVVIKSWKFNRPRWVVADGPSIAGLLAVLLLTTGGLACGTGSSYGGYPPQISPAEAGSWLQGGGDLHNTRFQGSETAINSSNVSELAPKWVVDVAGDVSATPTTDGTNVYFPDWGGYINALAAATGKVIWQRDIFSRTSPVIVDGGAAVIVGTPLFAGVPASIIKMDARTGASIWTTIVDPHPAAVVTATPVVARNTIMVGVSSSEEAFAADPSYPCCSFRGSVVAVDETTGSILWKTYMLPENGGVPGGYSGAAVWGSTPMVDLDRGLVCVATGNNYSVPDEVAACELLMPKSLSCIDHDNRIDSVVAMDLTTGTIRWTFQATFSDNSTNGCLFGVNCELPEGPDHDFAQGPLFVNTAFGPVVFAGQKSGVGYGLNADSGVLLWHTQIGTQIMWGSATDGCQIYVASRRNFTDSVGAWSALNPATGKILWTTNDPGSASDHAATVGPVSVANGVVYGSSENVNEATMFGLDAKTGEILFSFNSGSSVAGGPSIAQGVVYWGSGYSKVPVLTGNKKIYAFTLSGK